MRPTWKHAPLAVALCLLTRPLLAADGILIVEKTTTGNATKTNQVQIEKTRMRAETDGPNGGKQVIVFDAGAQVMRLIDYEKKTYTEMTKADVEKAGAQVAGAMAQMQEQMKNLPPAQRAQMEAMMKNMPGMAPPVKTEYRKTGADQVGKWRCDKYEGYQNNQKTSDLCTVDPKTLGFTPADFQISQQLGEFFQKLMPQAAEQMFTLGKNDPQGFSGIPVRRTVTVLGRQSVIELTDATRQTFPDSLFAIPAGFQKQAFGPPGR